MLSIYETYRDVMIDKRMFLSYGSASPVKHDPQTDVHQMAQSSWELSNDYPQFLVNKNLTKPY